MEWFEGIILGLVQGLTEFLPVSSSGHLMIAREILGIEMPDDDAFLSFEVMVHAATVLATIVVFRRQIWQLLCGLFKFKYNEETDYILKICVSMIPVFIVGMFFKDEVTALFSGLQIVGFSLLVTAVLLFLSDKLAAKGDKQCLAERKGYRNGISYLQAFVVGLGQAIAVTPGLSRSGTTISTGLLCGVKRSDMAQFSFLMVLAPILGEAFLDLLDGGFGDSAAAIGSLPLVLGFVSAFISGLFACEVMIALVKKASLKWFALYCAIVGVAILAFIAYVMYKGAAVLPGM
ncbi:MAG: undecaprenyl-diphosphate phosphatase [Bacteroidales bacterium]|nr:undecaprenyl-diphosphate phosphatase [Candidatus Hennigimonas equi]